MLRHFFAFCCLIILNHAVFADDNPCKTKECIAVIDAGSTGSRLHIYAYEDNQHLHPESIKELWNKKIVPGLATTDSSPKAIDAYLSHLLADAPIKKLPVYFYATGGMRLLPDNKQQLYYKQLSLWFEQHKEWSLLEAKTIPGEEEGLYDWLSVNYYLDTFNKEGQTIGVMDMGGASVQIVFPVMSTEASEPGIKNITINNKHYSLYIHSFLGLGQTEVFNQFNQTKTCFSEHYPLSNGGEGQGDATSCADNIADLMNRTYQVKELIQPLLATQPVDSWYSIGGISYVADNPLFHFSNSQFTNQELLQQADNQLCHQQWDVINKQFPDNEYLPKYCLFSAYYYALMVNGYGLHPQQSIHYIPAEENIDWTKGVVLYLLSQKATD
ncbi:MAG: multidrug DMT transporter permease [Legionella sp.]|nr:MAG: multidrug DMT transporter permease [Legionella sp.]PJD98645.1 MAG: multidrug DMT transporter permease [Legionella sp.]